MKPVFFIALLTSVLTVNLYLLLSPSYVGWQYSRPAAGTGNAGSDVNQALAIVDYLKHKTDRLPILSHKERSHLADVRDLFDLAFTVFKLALAVLLLASAPLIKSMGRRPFQRYLALCGAGGLAILTAFSWAALLDFNWLFNRFHGLFFIGDSWLFDANSLLIRLFPLEFWARAGLHWALLTMVELAVIATGAVIAGRRS